MKRFLIFGFTLFLFSCQQSTELPELDLLKYGLAIKINAPEDAEVEANDMGIAKDVSVKSGSDFYIQIVNSNAVEFNAQKLKQAE